MILLPDFRYAAVCMMLAALLSAPARAQPLPGAEKVGFADMSGWWLAAPGAAPRPAAISLHGCDGVHPRIELDARERAMAQLLQARGYHLLLPEPCSVNLHGAVDWLAARPEVDRARIVVLGWLHGGSTLLAALQHRLGPMPLQARAAVAFSPDCSLYGHTQGSYLPVAPLLILVDAIEQRTPAAPCLELANWTPKVMVRVLPESGHHAALLDFLERELR
jgi:dienelactone hydrolase